MTESSINRRYGWHAGNPDFRDRMRVARPETLATLPPMIDLRPGFPSPCYDQGQSSSCTANSIAGAIQFDLAKQKLPIFMPSRLWIYWSERSMEGTTGQDCGAVIRDGIKSINSAGVCDEKDWPFDLSKLTTKPTDNCFAEALGNKAVMYEAVNQDLQSIKATLAEGLPIVFGFTVFAGFESPEVARTGIVPMPSPAEECLGGHAVVACSFNDGPDTVAGIPPQHFGVRNSWGQGWGMDGYFAMPYAYLANPNLAADLWCLQTLSEGTPATHQDALHHGFWGKVLHRL